MVSNERIQQWLGGDAPTAAEVKELGEEMPWWLLPAAMRLRNGRDLSADERSALASRLAVGAPRPRADGHGSRHRPGA